MAYKRNCSRPGESRIFRTHRRAPAVLALVLLSLIAFAHGSAWSQACQIPLTVQKGNVDANVMILFDNSGSMNEAMEDPAYDPAVVYPGDRDPSSIYFIAVPGLYETNSVTAFLVAGPNGELGRYYGNYLNWIYYVATDEQRAAIPVLTKMDVAQTVVKGFINDLADVFVGLSVFNGKDGATILADCGTAPATLMTLVDGLRADAASPLGEALEDLLDYYMQTGPGTVIEYTCQSSFIIVMTDGLPTFDLDVSAYLVDADGDGNDPGDCTSIGSSLDNTYDCSDHMDDVAYWMRHNDLISIGDPHEDWEDGQTVVTYTVGFTLDDPMLEETARNGDGLYLSVNNAAELGKSLESIMVNIRQRDAAGASVAIVSSESTDESFIYRGKYDAADWMGFIECFSMPYTDMEQPVWEAGKLLSDRAASSRYIFTWSGGNVMNFTAGNAGPLRAAMNASDDVEAADLINWTRGDDIERFRHRNLNWKLGDVVHAAPKVVGPPSFFLDDEDYQNFLLDGSDRKRMIYVGANDGMLHAFRADDGYEEWAFIPEYALSMLKDIADTNYCHLFSVDLTASVCDALVGGVWKTVLVTGARQGGPGYFCLDITDPDAPSVLWETNLPDGLAYGSEVQFARIGGRDVVLIGSGYDEWGGQARLFEIDLATGAVLGDLLLSSQPGSRNKATTPSPVDVNFDGDTDLAYVGDLLGTLHRVKFNGSTSTGAWTVNDLFAGNRPISAQPKAAFGEGGDIYVYFGTGIHLDPIDLLSLDQEYFYCLFDRMDGNEATDLVDQTYNTSDIGTADGWFIQLVLEDGERIIEPAAVAAENVFVSSFAPFAEACLAGGESFFYKLGYEDGEDLSGDFEPGLTKFRGGGIASRPVLDILHGTVIIQNSNRTITVEDMGSTYDILRVKAWQEDFDETLATIANEHDND